MSKSKEQQQIDMLFGYMQSMHAMISALIADHHEREGLEAHIDFRLEPYRATILNSGRSDVTLEAFDEMTASFKTLITRPFDGWRDDFDVMTALEKRLAKGPE
jgi:hypothetical protein